MSASFRQIAEIDNDNNFTNKVAATVEQTRPDEFRIGWRKNGDFESMIVSAEALAEWIDGIQDLIEFNSLTRDEEG